LAIHLAWELPVTGNGSVTELTSAVVLTLGRSAHGEKELLPATVSEVEQLLAAMAAVRRTTRRIEGRPALLESLTGSQLELVKLVSRQPGVSVAEAADALRLAANTVSTLVGQLTDASVLVRRNDAGDRRVARLYLEEATDRHVSDWRDRRAEVVTSAMSRLSPRDRRRLVDATPALRRLVDAIASAGEA
jgi:DNA-binding MarR family transcriptional regulator